MSEKYTKKTATENAKFQELLEKSVIDWASLNDGEMALAKASFNAKAKGILTPTFGLGMQVTWEREVPLIVTAMREYGVTEIYFANGESGAIQTLGLFTEFGATIGGIVKLEISKESMRSIGEDKWAFVIRV